MKSKLKAKLQPWISYRVSDFSLYSTDGLSFIRLVLNIKKRRRQDSLFECSRQKYADRRTAVRPYCESSKNRGKTGSGMPRP